VAEGIGGRDDPPVALAAGEWFVDAADALLRDEGDRLPVEPAVVALPASSRGQSARERPVAMAASPSVVVARVPWTISTAIAGLPGAVGRARPG
jgi:hypothetical protein